MPTAIADKEIEGVNDEKVDDGTLSNYDHFPARAQSMGPPTQDQLAVIRAHVSDESILTEHEPYVWRAIVSNQSIDAYFTRMHESSLRNYAKNATDGLSYMNSHRTGGFGKQAELPMGRSFDGKYIGGNDKRVEEAFYTLRGLNLNGLPTDNFIDGLRSGIAKDVSIGFYGGEYMCSICDRNWETDWDCPHWPGMTYAIKDDKGQPTDEKELAYLWVHNASQAEVSSVYDGATPGAMVIRANRMADAGLIEPQKARLLEARYRISLPQVKSIYRGLDMSTQREPTMPTDDPVIDPIEEKPEGEVEVPTDLTVANDQLAVSIKDALTRASAPENASISWLVDEVIRLRPLADDGVAYRTDLINEALAQGVRAHGNDFSKESYTAVMQNATLDTIKRMRDDWKRVADSTLKGGRQTADENDRTKPESKIPASAYATRIA